MTERGKKEKSFTSFHCSFFKIFESEGKISLAFLPFYLIDARKSKVKQILSHSISLHGGFVMDDLDSSRLTNKKNIDCKCQKAQEQSRGRCQVLPGTL